MTSNNEKEKFKRLAKNIEKRTVDFYNAVGGHDVSSVEEIPTEQLLFIKAFDYLEMIKPLISVDLKSGKSRAAIALKYCIREDYVRTIGRKLGFYSKRK